MKDRLMELETKRDEEIKKYFNTTWNLEDFWSAYLQTNNLDEDDMTDDEYEKHREIMCNSISVGMLNGLRQKYIEEINEMLVIAISE